MYCRDTFLVQRRLNPQASIHLIVMHSIPGTCVYDLRSIQISIVVSAQIEGHLHEATRKADPTGSKAISEKTFVSLIVSADLAIYTACIEGYIFCLETASRSVER